MAAGSRWTSSRTGGDYLQRGRLFSNDRRHGSKKAGQVIDLMYSYLIVACSGGVATDPPAVIYDRSLRL